MKPTIHFAEQDDVLRVAYRDYCCLLGFDAETSADSQDCRRSLSHKTPDVLVLDLDIPGDGGGLVFAYLRERAMGSSQPHLFITGNETPQSLSRQTGLPALRCFQKPFRLGSLLDSISGILDADPTDSTSLPHADVLGELKI